MFSTTTMLSSTSSPQGEHEAGDRELIDREAEGLQQGQSDQQRERDGDHHHAGRAETQRQEGDRHQAKRDREVPEELAQPMLHVLRLHEAKLELHTPWQGALELRKRRLDRLGHLGDVGAVLLGGGDEERASPVEPRQVLGLRLRPLNLRHITHPHDLAIDFPHRRVGHILEAAEGAAGFHVEASLPDVHRADRRVCASRPKRVSDGRGRQTKLGQATEVEGDAKLR